MLHRSNHNHKHYENRRLLYNPDGIKFFHFDLSEKNHEIILPVEEETAWEQLNEITWDPGRSD